MFIDELQLRQYQPSDDEQVRRLHEAALRATNAFAEGGQWDSDLGDVVARRLYETSGYTEQKRETEGWPLEVIFYKKELAQRSHVSA